MEYRDELHEFEERCWRLIQTRRGIKSWPGSDYRSFNIDHMFFDVHYTGCDTDDELPNRDNSAFSLHWGDTHVYTGGDLHKRRPAGHVISNGKLLLQCLPLLRRAMVLDDLSVI